MMFLLTGSSRYGIPLPSRCCCTRCCCCCCRCRDPKRLGGDPGEGFIMVMMDWMVLLRQSCPNSSNCVHDAREIEPAKRGFHKRVQAMAMDGSTTLFIQNIR